MRDEITYFNVGRKFIVRQGVKNFLFILLVGREFVWNLN
jgi:hypothetical protein